MLLSAAQYGLDYNGFRKVVSPTAQGSGRYFLGLGHRFIVYPRTYQTIEYSNAPGANAGPLQSRTKDGVEVVVMISFQYQVSQHQPHPPLPGPCCPSFPLNGPLTCRASRHVVEV